MVVAFKAMSLSHSGGLSKIKSYPYTPHTGEYFQQLEPKKSKCFKLKGNYENNPGYLDNDRKGMYMYIHWPKLECCETCIPSRQVDE